MNFASDNWAGVTPEIMTAIARHNDGFATAYGGDALTASVTERFSEIFEREVAVYFTATGTASNALSMAACARPGGVILCSDGAHLLNDEYGASEFFTGGMKPVPLTSTYGLIAPKALEAGLKRFPKGGRGGEPVVLSLTQMSEAGTVYAASDITALSDLAHAHSMVAHMDGARFANAVAASGATPAELSWRAGIDLMSFGGTKNGCLGAEAIVVFEPERWRDLDVLRARSGHVLSKARFVAAQFEAYFAGNHWLNNAAHANAMAQRLAAGISASPNGRLAWPSQGNEVFAILNKVNIASLRKAGAKFHPWPDATIVPGDNMEMVRLVASFATSPKEVETFLSLI